MAETRIIELVRQEKGRLWDGASITNRRVFEKMEALHIDLVLCESAMRCCLNIIRTERNHKAKKLRQERWLESCRRNSLAEAEERAG